MCYNIIECNHVSLFHEYAEIGTSVQQAKHSTGLSTYSLLYCCLLFPRFLRHVPVIYVDYPGATSLTQIYGTFNRAMLRLVPNLRTYADPLTNAMVDFYTQSQVQQDDVSVLLFNLGTP